MSSYHQHYHKLIDQFRENLTLIRDMMSHKFHLDLEMFLRIILINQDINYNHQLVIIGT